MVLSLLVAPAAVSGPWAIAAPAAAFDWERAISLYKQGRYAESIREFELVLAEHPDHADSSKYIGLAWFQLKEHARAIEPLQRSLELKRREGRNDGELYLALGQSLLILNRFDEALPHLETLARLQPGSATNLYLLGVVYANLNRPEDSLEAMRRSFQLNPRDTDTIQYIANRQLHSGQTREALGLIRQGLSSAPESPELLRLLTEASLRSGAAESDEKAATASFNEAIRAAQRLAGLRQDAATIELLGQAYLAARKYPLAEQ
ncbi:MAG: tetratricopeptide repeat protein, partial [Acidobacteriota bacterium]